MSEPHFQPGATATVGVLAASLSMPTHSHSALSEAALAPTSHLRVQQADIAVSLVVNNTDVGDALSRRVQRADARVQGDLTVQGRVHAGRLEGAQPPSLWRDPIQSRPALWFGRTEVGQTTLPAVDLPATGAGRLLVLLLWNTGTGSAPSPGRLGLQLVLVGPRGGRAAELLIPIARHELSPGERAALDTAPDFSAWRAARPGATRGGWMGPDRSSGQTQGVPWYAVVRSASFSVAFPAPRQSARIELLRDSPDGDVGTHHLLQVVFLPGRTP
ncbi:MAG TPA: hypothetical protein PLA94_21425 [Myxococcota bacterium]|nr:hypothetical protein [Myxococcota bacterium]